MLRNQAIFVECSVARDPAVLKKVLLVLVSVWIRKAVCDPEKKTSCGNATLYRHLALFHSSILSTGEFVKFALLWFARIEVTQTCDVCDKDEIREEFNECNNIGAAGEAFLEHTDQIVKAPEPEKLESGIAGPVALHPGSPSGASGAL